MRHRESSALSCTYIMSVSMSQCSCSQRGSLRPVFALIRSVVLGQLRPRLQAVMSLELGAKLGLCAVSVRLITRSTCHTILRSVGIIFADVTDEHLIVCRHQLECIDAPTSRCGSTMSDNVRLAKCTAVSAPTSRTSVATRLHGFHQKAASG